MSWKYLLVPMLACRSLHSLVEHQINEKTPINVTFSKNAHNRISVENGSVDKVFGDDAYFHINLDQTTGNAFVTLRKEIGEVPAALTVVTSSGFIQDLSVSSEEKIGEHLLLKEEAEDDFVETSAYLHGQAVEFLNRILEGKPPLGYGQRGIKEKERLRLPYPLQATPIAVFEGPFENIFVYEIVNLGKQRIVISADSIKKDDVSWVFLGTQKLKKKETARCIISQPKQES